MPSLVLGYVAGSGYSPLISGNPWSGHLEPVGGIQLVMDRANSGSVYISLSGGNAFSGQMSTLVGSGGPTINSGGMPLSGGGLMDGLQLGPGAAYFVPALGIANKGSVSGTYSLCCGCDTAVSGLGRIYYEIY